ALEMLNGERARSRLTPQEREETLQREEVSVVPLGIPLLAGPGAITTVMIYMTAPVSDPADKLFVFAGILVAVLSAFVLLHNADRIFRKIGRTGTRAIGRVMGLRAKPLLVGSVAKGVHLTGTEIDIFVAFPPDTPREFLEREGLALGDVLERPVRMYAEHPYTRGWYDGFEVEVVPCYRITDA